MSTPVMGSAQMSNIFAEVVESYETGEGDRGADKVDLGAGPRFDGHAFEPIPCWETLLAMSC